MRQIERLSERSCMQLDLARIEASLRKVQQDLDRINERASAIRDPLGEHTIGNMLEGYRCVERFVRQGIDLFALGESQQLLELNRIVLCGVDSQLRDEHRGHLLATERRYYDEPNAGIGDLVEWYKLSLGESVWDRAAGAYVRLLMHPQLFIEGNHRTGALLMSYILLVDGEPPFVLSPENAVDCFVASGILRGIRKNSVTDFLHVATMRRRMVELLRQDSDSLYLLAAGSQGCTQIEGPAHS